MLIPVLETRGLDKRYGALHVTRSVDFVLRRGSRHALIGPNGAGKTTLVGLITGVVRPGAGSIHLDGADVSRLGAAQRVKRGLVRTFQISQLFAGLTVVENLALALAEREGVAWRMLRPLSGHRALLEEGLRVLRSLDLGDLADHPIAALAYGQQRLVELAMAVACRPLVLLLDEPAAGVAAAETDLITACLRQLGSDISILLIDHDMDLVFSFADTVSVLVDGAIVATGSPAEIAADPLVRRVYLGEGLDG